MSIVHRIFHGSNVVVVNNQSANSKNFSLPFDWMLTTTFAPWDILWTMLIKQIACRKCIVRSALSPHFPSQPDQSDTIQAGTLQDSLPGGGSHSSSSGGFSDPAHLLENSGINFDPRLNLPHTVWFIRMYEKIQLVISPGVCSNLTSLIPIPYVIP